MSEQQHEQAADPVERGWHRLRLVPQRLWWPINALQLIFTLSWTAIGIMLALLIWLAGGSERLPLRMAAWPWSPGLLRGAGARLEVAGLENLDFSKPQLLVANHQSMIDICALFAAVPVPLRFMLKASLGRVPFLGWYTRAMGMILLPRGRPHAARDELARAAELLRAGHCLAAFPEGTRSRDGSVGQFKSGVFRAAIAAGVPVVPVALDGSGQIMPPGSFRIRPGRIRLAFGKPISCEGMDIKRRHELAQRAFEAVRRLKQGLD